MEIDITDFFENKDPSEFSASQMELGKDAGKITWKAAMQEADDTPILKNDDELDAFRHFTKGFGAWSKEEIAAWSSAECNALFIQFVSGDMREGGLDQAGLDFESSEWIEYRKGAESGRYAGRIFNGDDGRVYFMLDD